MTIEIRILKPDEAAALDRVAADVFDSQTSPELVTQFLKDPRHHLAVASDGDTIVGMASAVDYVHPDKPVELWINEVGVAPAYQRAGIGRQLLEALFSLGRDLGCGEAWVATEHDNAPARGLYAATGGRDESFVMYSFNLKKGSN